MKNEINADFKFLEIPSGEDVLGFLGSEGIREYGMERGHFHNLMEISVCRWGSIYIKPSAFLAEIYQEEGRKCRKYVEEAEQKPFMKSRKEIPDLAEEINLIMNQLRVKDYQYHNCIRGLLFAMLMEIIKINHRDYEDLENKTVYNQRHPLFLMRLSSDLCLQQMVL